jgi:transcription elongation factor GreA
VGDDEADLKEGKISVSSPLARAIIGKSVGDEVVAKTPGGEVIYEIIEVRYL